MNLPELFQKRLVIAIPYLDNEVYDLERLFELRGYMFESGH
jgi:hypothetical protein